MRGVYVPPPKHHHDDTVLTCPQAHAHIATLHYLSTASSSPPSLSALALALKHFCRAIELNAAYLRGYYGLKLLCRVLLPLLPAASQTVKRQDADDDVPVPALATVQKLDELATAKLAEMVREFAARKHGASGYDAAEIEAARELLAR
jgi:hypothetical protein